MKRRTFAYMAAMAASAQTAQFQDKDTLANSPVTLVGKEQFKSDTDYVKDGISIRLVTVPGQDREYWPVVLLNSKEYTLGPSKAEIRVLVEVFYWAHVKDLTTPLLLHKEMLIPIAGTDMAHLGDPMSGFELKDVQVIRARILVEHGTPSLVFGGWPKLTTNKK